MGNWVTAEALRQIKISAKLPPMNKLGGRHIGGPGYRHRCVQIADDGSANRESPSSLLCLTTINRCGSPILSRGVKHDWVRIPTMRLTALGAVVIGLRTLNPPIAAITPSSPNSPRLPRRCDRCLKEVWRRRKARGDEQGKRPLASVVEGPGGLGASDRIYMRRPIDCSGGDII